MDVDLRTVVRGYSVRNAILVVFGIALVIYFSQSDFVGLCLAAVGLGVNCCGLLTSALASTGRPSLKRIFWMKTTFLLVVGVDLSLTAYLIQLTAGSSISWISTDFRALQGWIFIAVIAMVIVWSFANREFGRQFERIILLGSTCNPLDRAPQVGDNKVASTILFLFFAFAAYSSLSIGRQAGLLSATFIMSFAGGAYCIGFWIANMLNVLRRL